MFVNDWERSERGWVEEIKSPEHEIPTVNSKFGGALCTTDEIGDDLGTTHDSDLREWSAELKVKEELSRGSDGAGSLDERVADEHGSAMSDAEPPAILACVVECDPTTMACGNS